MLGPAPTPRSVGASRQQLQLAVMYPPVLAAIGLDSEPIRGRNQNHYARASRDGDNTRRAPERCRSELRARRLHHPFHVVAKSFHVFLSSFVGCLRDCEFVLLLLVLALQLFGSHLLFLTLLLIGVTLCLQVHGRDVVLNGSVFSAFYRTI